MSISNKYQNLVIISFFMILVVASSGYTAHTAQSSPSDPLAWSTAMEETISKLDQGLKKQQSEKNTLLKESDRLAERIFREKQKSGMSGNRKLDALLQKSQQLVLDLELISRQIAETETQLREKYSLAMTALVRSLEHQPQGGPSEDKEKKILLTYLCKYLAKAEKFEEPIEFSVPQLSLEVQDNDTPVEIRAKADFLTDRTLLLKAKLFRLEAQLSKLEKEKVLREKVKRFADELNFFDDTIPVKEQGMPHGLSGTGDPTGNGQTEPILGNTSGETSSAPINRRDGFNLSPPGLTLSSNSIDEQIELLQEQKSRLANQIQHVLQKTQTFYQEAENRARNR